MSRRALLVWWMNGRGRLRERRAGPAAGASNAFESAVDVFLSEPALSPATVRSYRQTLTALAGALPGPELPGAEALEAALRLRWQTTAPATWNRHVSALRSFLAYAHRHRLLPAIDIHLDHRRVLEDNTRALGARELERIFKLNVPVREKALWRLLYETAARASEALSLDVEDLDLANRQATVISKGGARDLIYWQTPTARLLPKLVNGRSNGPVFLSDRCARLELPRSDLCSDTGRARLSYRRAAELFAQHTGHTLHQLRHTALTQLAEENVTLPLIMAVSRHQSLRSLQRYARPGPAAVARLAAERDPYRRARHGS